MEKKVKLISVFCVLLMAMSIFSLALIIADEDESSSSSGSENSGSKSSEKSESKTESKSESKTESKSESAKTEEKSKKADKKQETKTETKTETITEENGRKIETKIEIKDDKSVINEKTVYIDDAGNKVTIKSMTVISEGQEQTKTSIKVKGAEVNTKLSVSEHINQNGDVTIKA